MEQGSTSLSISDCNGYGSYSLQPKYKVFLSHSGAQKGFVEQLCVDLERCDRHPFFDKRRDCLPIGKEFPRLIFETIEQCEVGVVVLSEEFFTSKWPMLELVAMANVKKRKPSFTIIPILLGLTFSECRDVTNHHRWLLLWHSWVESDSRINVKDWEDALQLFGPTNALKYNFELGEVAFRSRIVEVICKLVPPRTQFEDSHIQGRSRLCKVIHERIQHSKVSPLYGIRVVGLYGVGGIGKTTICKSMCNYVSKACCGKVAHMELGSQSEGELFKDVLQRLTSMNLEHLGAMSVDEYRYRLMRDMINVKVFLAIDNVSSATSKQALTLLRANYGYGSVLLVTARSLNELTSLRIDVSECMEMPELEMEEARSLFLYHVACVPPIYLSNKDDQDLILSCVEQCHFKKGNGISSHYHPLALQTLGEQLGVVGYVPERWRSLLYEIDFLNPFGEPQHRVFSILRRSFDALNFQDQLIFMDAALFAPYNGQYFWDGTFKCNIYEWLGMVHGMPRKNVMERLENLKRKSLLENLGDGFGIIGIHNLWREFARLECKVDKDNLVVATNMTNGGHRMNLRRMIFFDKGFMKVEDVNFTCFPNVTVLKLNTGFASVQELDLRGLRHLKSLEVDLSEYDPMRLHPLFSIIGLGSLLKLCFLRWLNIPSESPCIDEIVHLTNLQVLDLYRCDRLPSMRNLILLQATCFRENGSLVSIADLSSKHTNLQFLDLSGCKELQTCWILEDLVALEELCLSGCSKLVEVPNLRKLKRLQKLHVGWCSLLRALPGLGDLVNLLELTADWCENLIEVPDMCNLQNLRILDLSYCEHIESLPSLHALVSLQSLKMLDCKNLIQLPDMHKLMNLQTLALDPYCPPEASTRWSDLISLQNLHIKIDELQDEPNLYKLTKLEMLNILGWQGQGFSSLGQLISLESVTIDNCKGVHALPNLKRLSKLRDLKFRRCDFEDLSSLINLTTLKVLEITDCDKLDALPNLHELVKLEDLKVKRGELLKDVSDIFGLENLKFLRVISHVWLDENLTLNLLRLKGLHVLDVSDNGFIDLHGLIACSQIRTLICKRCPIQELPDLANFPNICWLDMHGCKDLTELICTRPLSSKFRYLDVHGCMKLHAIPNVTNSRKMQLLDVANSGVVLTAYFIQDMKARWPSIDLIIEDTLSWI